MKPGDRCWVKVGRRRYPAVVDEHGVLRFRANRLLKHLLDTGQLNLNVIAVDYGNGKFSEEEYLDLIRWLGYSLDGFCDLSAFEHLKVSTPGWVRDPENRVRIAKSERR